jgi:PQQ-dependent dehydrogenase (methanol/ethanol family)
LEINMQINKIKLALGLVAGLSVAMPMIASAAADQEAAMKDPNNWAHPRGQHNNQGYSTLAQVNKGNIKNLKMAWTFATGVNRGHEGSPVVVGNMMYVHTAFPNNVYALDLNDNQKIVWSYFPKQDPSVQAVLCCDNVSRGLGYGDGKIYLQQNDGNLVALDAKSGKKIWSVLVNDPKVGATNTNAPHVIKDKVLTGCSGAEFGVRCFLIAYNSKDGSVAWKAYSTGPDAETLHDKNTNKDNPQYNALSVYEDVNGGNKVGGSFKPLPLDKMKIGEQELGTRTWLKPQAVQDGWQHGGGSTWGW